MGLLTLKLVTDVRDLDYEVVEFHGELDKSTIPTTEQQMYDLIGSFQRHFLVLDLGDLTFINSEGIGFIVSIHMKLVKKNQVLLMAGMKPNVADVLELIGLPKLIPTFATVADAIQHIKKTHNV